MAEYDLLALVRCHQRPEELKRVTKMLLDDMRLAGINVFVVLAPDPRSSPAVWTVVNDAVLYPWCMVVNPPLPVMSPQHGQRWIETLNWMADRFDETGHTARWVCDFDDDQVFAHGYLPLLKECLAREDVEAWRSVTLYFWDPEEQWINIDQYHWSATIGRYRRGARRRTDRCIEIPDFVQDAVDTRPDLEQTLPFYLLDFGTKDAAVRQRLYREYARAGKLDNYTRKYVTKPTLLPLAKILADFPNPADFESWQKAYVLGDVKVEE